MFISAGLNIKIHKWPSDSKDCALEYTPHSAVPIRQISLCNDNTYLAYLQENKKCQIISLRKGSDIHHVHTISSVKDITAICFKHFTKRFLALGTQQGDVLIYDTKERNDTKRLKNLSSSVNIIQFASDDQLIGVSSEDIIAIYDTRDDDPAEELHQTSTCTAMKFHPSILNRFAVGCKKGKVSIWDINSATKLVTFNEHLAKITGIAFSTTSNLIVSAAEDHKMCILNENTSKAEFRMSLCLPVLSVDVSKDDKYIAAGLEDGSVHIYDLRKPVLPLHSLKSHVAPVSAIAFENIERQITLSAPEIMPKVSTTQVGECRNIDPPFMQISSEICSNKKPNPFIQKIRSDAFRFIKSEMDDLENQLDEHCLKFKAFLHNEVNQLHRIVREKWNIFTIAGSDKMANNDYHDVSPRNE